MNIILKIIVLSIYLLVANIPVYSRDLGNHGAVFEIKEPDLLKQIYKRLMQFSPGDIAYHQRELAKKMKSAIESPKSAKYLPKAVKARSFKIDPSFTLDQDYTDDKGNLIAVKGTTINPLDHLNYDKELIFIDSTDQAQVTWLRAQNKTISRKIILVAGQPFKLEQQIAEPVYFDQQAFMVKKFGITAVPATVKQEGSVFRVEEILTHE